MAKPAVGLHFRPQKNGYLDHERAVKYSTVNRVEDQLAMLMGGAPIHAQAPTEILSYDDYRRQQQATPQVLSEQHQPQLMVTTATHHLHSPAQPAYPPGAGGPQVVYAPRISSHGAPQAYAPPGHVAAPGYPPAATGYQAQPIAARGPVVIQTPFAPPQDPHLHQQFQQMSVSPTPAPTPASSSSPKSPQKEKASPPRSSSASGGRHSSHHKDRGSSSKKSSKTISSDKKKDKERRTRDSNSAPKSTSSSSSKTSKTPEGSASPSSPPTPPPSTEAAISDPSLYQTKEDILEYIHVILFSILGEIQQFRKNMDAPVPGFTVQSMAVKVVGEAKTLGRFIEHLTITERTHELIKTEITGALQRLVNSLGSFIKGTQTNPTKEDAMATIMVVATNAKALVGALRMA